MTWGHSQVTCNVVSYDVLCCNMSVMGNIWEMWVYHILRMIGQYFSPSTWWHWPIVHIDLCKIRLYHICFVFIFSSILSHLVLDCGYESRSGQTKDYKLDICCFSAKHAELRRKSTDCLALNQDNVSEWDNVFTQGLFFQWTSTIKIKLSV
jgi:hypothetical protein